jgi:hypothetical protein
LLIVKPECGLVLKSGVEFCCGFDAAMSVDEPNDTVGAWMSIEIELGCDMTEQVRISPSIRIRSRYTG